MNVTKNKVTHNPDDEGNVDVLNLKIDPKARDEILSIDGIYPGYHMNHKSWVSIVLDDKIDDEKVLDLLSVSRDFAMKK
jgi:predicted DNA-binding protein (MmcQ/YjbR family)